MDAAGFVYEKLGTGSVSLEKSYRKISQSDEIWCSALKFDRHLSSSAAETPAKFQSNWTILTPGFASLRLCEILWSDTILNWPMMLHYYNNFSDSGACAICARRYHDSFYDLFYPISLELYISLIYSEFRILDFF